MIKHISFDFWNTLYIGNPKFKQSRAEFLSSRYDLDVSTILSKISSVKNFCDKTSEHTLTAIGSELQYLHLLMSIGVQSKCIRPELNIITRIANALFIEHPPIPIIDWSELEKLKDKYSISISCNTGFISGQLIDRMLTITGVENYFDFTLFSDLIGHSKPSPLFAEQILIESEVEYFNEILHIGDNVNTDGKMCNYTLINYFQNPKDSIDLFQISNIVNE